MQRKVLVTGASGLLGRQIQTVLSFLPSLTVTGLCHSRPGPDLTQLDLTDTALTAAFLTDTKPDIVIHCAAQRFPDRVDADPEAAQAINVSVSRHLAILCRDLGARLLYISTDYVFDGTKAPYSHTDTPRPTNRYGETKLAGETAILSVDPSNLILRIPVLYGPVLSLGESAVTVLLDLVRKGVAATVSSYEVRCPAHTGDIARIVRDMVTREQALEGGVYQWSGLEKLSKWDMVQMISSETGLSICHLTEQREPGTGATVRPRDVEMERVRLENLGISHHINFRQGLVEALKPFL